MVVKHKHWWLLENGRWRETERERGGSEELWDCVCVWMQERESQIHNALLNSVLYCFNVSHIALGASHIEGFSASEMHWLSLLLNKPVTLPYLNNVGDDVGQHGHWEAHDVEERQRHKGFLCIQNIVRIWQSVHSKCCQRYLQRKAEHWPVGKNINNKFLNSVICTIRQEEEKSGRLALKTQPCLVTTHSSDI